MSLNKTISDDSTLGIKKAEVTLTAPSITIEVLRANETQFNQVIRSRLLDILGEYIDKELAK
tara:strand:+ start:1684 stop:1869 length:186 start_codon:yes stop_codon:yes gene_type:complete